MKHELYATNSTSVLVRPLNGVYIISTVPRMKPPPTHVAAGQISAQKIVHAKSSLVIRPSKYPVIIAIVKCSSWIYLTC